MRCTILGRHSLVEYALLGHLVKKLAEINQPLFFAYLTVTTRIQLSVQRLDLGLLLLFSPFKVILGRLNQLASCDLTVSIHIALIEHLFCFLEGVRSLGSQTRSLLFLGWLLLALVRASVTTKAVIFFLLLDSVILSITVCLERVTTRTFLAVRFVIT